MESVTTKIQANTIQHFCSNNHATLAQQKRQMGSVPSLSLGRALGRPLRQAGYLA
ncbi:hypothetical protein FC61_GL001654 [Levilactobacillus brevis ATCC 14869 = DSM 20054]|nr:hypothetical protein FC61_GL001654 [Levilactobacillus brevis ATCC 14869 = DSM 20054]